MLGFTFRGTHTSAFTGLAVKTINNPLIPARKINRVNIPGRDGSYVFEDGFENRTLEFRCTLTKGSIALRRNRAREIAAWLSGTGNLVLDHENNKTYKVIRTVSDVALTVNKMIDEFSITFETEPFQYGSFQTISVDSPTAVTITNNGKVPADTVVSITGTGNITITTGSQSFTLAGVTEKLNLDSKKMLVYTDSMENQMVLHTGGFIKLAPGANTIALTGTVSNITIQFNDTYL